MDNTTQPPELNEKPQAKFEHTPGPWNFDTDDLGTWINSDAHPQPIAKMGLCTNFNTRANAAFIVRAVNAHDGMLAALFLAESERDYLLTEMENLTCSDLCDKTYEQQGCPSGTCARENGIRKFRKNTKTIRAAIAKAKGA